MSCNHHNHDISKDVVNTKDTYFTQILNDLISEIGEIGHFELFGLDVSHVVLNFLSTIFTNTNTSTIAIAIAFLFLGVVNSFIHCIGMCGPIATGQVSLRLMQIPIQKVTEKARFMSSIATTYYVGKAITYAILSLISGLSIHIISKTFLFKFAKVSVISFIAIFFTYQGLKKFSSIWQNLSNYRMISKQSMQYDIIQDNLNKKVNTKSNINPNAKKNNKVADYISNKYYKIIILPFIKFIQNIKIKKNGFIFGMLLGMIPCGLVYAIILEANTISDNLFLSALYTFMFGMGTFPGLFVISYLGQQILFRIKYLLDFMYAITMLLNSMLLFKYILY